MIPQNYTLCQQPQKLSGRTSEIIGTWLKKSGNRDKVVLASKIAGTGDYTAHIRTTGFSQEGIKDAVDKELKRLTNRLY